VLPLASTSGTRKHAALLVGSGPPDQDTDNSLSDKNVLKPRESISVPLKKRTMSRLREKKATYKHINILPVLMKSA